MTGRFTALPALADSGLLIAAVNRGDRHHAWAVRHVLEARARKTKIAVPDAVLGEAFTKLRFDRRVSPRKDARIALAVFRMVEEADDVFELRFASSEAHTRARDILGQYSDQSFSYVDALAFSIADGDPSLNRVLTVDGRDFSTYRFAHPVAVVVP